MGEMDELDPLESRLRIRLVEATARNMPAETEAAETKVSARVGDLFRDGIIVPDAPFRDEQKRVFTLDASTGEGSLRNLRVFTLNLWKLVPALGKLAWALTKLEHDPADAVISGGELLLEVFKESHEHLDPLDADLLFALYSADETKPVAKSTEALAKEKKGTGELIATRLERLERLGAIRRRKDDDLWELVETVKVKF
jgi:hypothetical protein